MDTEEKPKRRRGRPRKNPESSPKPRRPRGRPRNQKVETTEVSRQELSDKQVMLLLTNYLKSAEGIKIDWDSVRKIHPNKYIYQVIVDKLSMKFLTQLQEIPLVKDVFFFSKVGSGVNGINLLFKVHIVFDTL
jgi:hypothetical protein